VDLIEKQHTLVALYNRSVILIMWFVFLNSDVSQVGTGIMLEKL